MCAVIGALVWNIDKADKLIEANNMIRYIMAKSVERGRDGAGYYVNDGSVLREHKSFDILPENCDFVEGFTKSAVFLSNLRAEPTTEYVKDKQLRDQQPYTIDPWTIVHNGTIANDKELRTYFLKTKIDSAAIVEHLARYKYDDSDPMNSFGHFYGALRDIKGSYAILANVESETNQIIVAANYRPVWYVKTSNGIFFASSRDYFPENYVPKMVEPYSINAFTHNGFDFNHYTMTLHQTPPNTKALVICSGGLDSVVAATLAKKKLGYDITLLHFEYGCRAEGNEVDSIKEVAKVLDVPYKIFPLPIYDTKDSPLFDHEEPIALGVSGAEFAHEWVPARNLVLLSVATAYAEANGFDTLILGNNLEEAGAYPDNEPEFIAKFNDILPFAIGDGKQLEVIMPVGNMMKHEIVALGHTIEAPMDKTWSCYYKGEKHCGRCGPCYMRRTAFEINNLEEVIEYVHDRKIP